MSFSTCTPPVPASSLVSCSYLFSFTVYPYLFTPAFKVFFRKIGRIFLTFGYICPPQRGRFLCLHTLYKVRRKKLLDSGESQLLQEEGGLRLHDFLGASLFPNFFQFPRWVWLKHSKGSEFFSNFSIQNATFELKIRKIGQK